MTSIHIGTQYFLVTFAVVLIDSNVHKTFFRISEPAYKALPHFSHTMQYKSMGQASPSTMVSPFLYEQRI